MKIKEKIKEAEKQCSVCAAQFEIWLNNSRMSDERREKMTEHLLVSCPVCSRVDEN
jgi:hypothetical protein